MIAKQSLKAILFTFVLTSANGAYAQSIIPANDGLNTNVNQVGNQYNITGGIQAGANLFYSLQKLGLSTGEIANLLSNPSVQNVLTRVTGGEASLINGLIQMTGGNSNLFILNPAGIVFGANASLNVPANFSATTATGIQVGSGWFGVNSSVDEIRSLNGNVTGYAFTKTLPSLDTTPSGVISNQGNLQTNIGKSVTLVGGMVVNTGTISTPSGSITIAATPDNKFIKISNEGSLMSLELPIADQQVVGNAPVLRGVDLPSLLIGKTSGTVIASAQVGDVIIADSFINAGTVSLHATNNLGVSNSWVVGADKLTVTGNNVSLKNAIVLAKDATVDANNNLNIAESLVRTTGNLALQANNVVTMRDSVKTPLVISSGGNLKIQGNNAIDIFALNHSNITPFISSGNLDLLSNGNVSFDSHSYSGGGFSIKKLDGNLGTFVSLFDPIISSNGNVTFGDYTGVSLKVETKGSITAGNITITGPDVGLVGTDPDIPTLTSSASLILRAGLTTLHNTPNNAPQTFGGATFTSTFTTTNVPYTLSTPTFNFQDISGTGTALTLGDDQVTGAIPLGFSFSFFGTNYTDVFVSSNGFITVLPAQSSGCCSGAPLPTGGGPNGVIAGWWTDLFPPLPAGASVRYQTTGTPGNQTFILQFTNVGTCCGGAAPSTWQTKLFEGTNNIESHYVNAAASGGNTYSAGIENATGTIGNQFYRGTAALPANTAVSYTPPLGIGNITVGNITTEGGPVILAAPGTITHGTITIKTPVVTPPVVAPKPNIDPNKETRRHDEKKELGLSSLTPVAFLSTDDIEFQRLDRFLFFIIELMNKDGGDLAIDAKDIWKDADISIFDQSSNQDVIKIAIRRSIGRFIGNEFIDLVDINFETKKDKKTILLKVRKSPKPAKFLKN